MTAIPREGSGLLSTVLWFWFSPRGRLRRQEVHAGVLPLLVFIVCTEGILNGRFAATPADQLLLIPTVVAGLTALYSLFVLMIKRGHDLGIPGIITFFALFLPVLQLGAVLMLLVFPSRAADNRYGPGPYRAWKTGHLSSHVTISLAVTTWFVGSMTAGAAESYARRLADEEIDGTLTENEEVWVDIELTEIRERQPSQIEREGEQAIRKRIADEFRSAAHDHLLLVAIEDEECPFECRLVNPTDQTAWNVEVEVTFSDRRLSPRPKSDPREMLTWPGIRRAKVLHVPHVPPRSEVRIAFPCVGHWCSSLMGSCVYHVAWIPWWECGDLSDTDLREMATEVADFVFVDGRFVAKPGNSTAALSLLTLIGHGAERHTFLTRLADSDDGVQVLTEYVSANPEGLTSAKLQRLVRDASNARAWVLLDAWIAKDASSGADEVLLETIREHCAEEGLAEEERAFLRWFDAASGALPTRSPVGETLLDHCAADSERIGHFLGTAVATHDTLKIALALDHMDETAHASAIEALGRSEPGRRVLRKSVSVTGVEWQLERLVDDLRARDGELEALILVLARSSEDGLGIRRARSLLQCHASAEESLDQESRTRLQLALANDLLDGSIPEGPTRDTTKGLIDVEQEPVATLLRETLTRDSDVFPPETVMASSMAGGTDLFDFLLFDRMHLGDCTSSTDALAACAAGIEQSHDALASEGLDAGFLEEVEARLGNSVSGGRSDAGPLGARYGEWGLDTASLSADICDLADTKWQARGFRAARRLTEQARYMAPEAACVADLDGRLRRRALHQTLAKVGFAAVLAALLSGGFSFPGRKKR